MLIIDYDSDDRWIMRESFATSASNPKVIEAASSLEALELLQTGVIIPVLILLDYNMPAYNGLETIAQIKTMQPNIPVALMTTSLNDEIIAQATFAGARCCIAKPIKLKDVAEPINFLFDEFLNKRESV